MGFIMNFTKFFSDYITVVLVQQLESDELHVRLGQLRNEKFDLLRRLLWNLVHTNYIHTVCTTRRAKLESHNTVICVQICIQQALCKKCKLVNYRLI